MGLESDVRKLGYHKEEEYFYKKNKELIEKMREKYNAERAKREAEEKQKAHWMKCPKCGSDLKEIELLGIKVDRCVGCDGIYFDKGELETVLAAQEPKGFVNYPAPRAQGNSRWGSLASSMARSQISTERSPIRSRSVVIFIAVVIKRRSRASG